jgi:hypothetical protein
MFNFAQSGFAQTLFGKQIPDFIKELHKIGLVLSLIHIELAKMNKIAAGREKEDEEG